MDPPKWRVYLQHFTPSLNKKKKKTGKQFNTISLANLKTAFNFIHPLELKKDTLKILVKKNSIYRTKIDQKDKYMYFFFEYKTLVCYYNNTLNCSPICSQ